MKFWVDDLRTPPEDADGWVWCKSSQMTINWLNFALIYDHEVHFMSLDHDLGGLDTTRPVVLWCCENEFWPTEVRVHTANPVGREWLTGMIERYKV